MGRCVPPCWRVGVVHHMFWITYVSTFSKLQLRGRRVFGPQFRVKLVELPLQLDVEAAVGWVIVGANWDGVWSSFSFQSHAEIVVCS